MDKSICDRVLHVFGVMDCAGAESRIMDVYRNIDREKLQFDFVVFEGNEGYFDREIEKLGGRKFIVRHPRKDGIIKNLIDYYKVIKNNGPYKAIHSHTSYHSAIPLLASKLAGIKIRIAHARTTSSRDRSFIGTIYSRLGRFFLNIISTKKLAISKAAGEYVFGNKASKKGEVQVIPNAINLQKYIYEDIEQVKTLRRSLGIYNENIVIGQVGRFNKVKNHNFTINLAKELREMGIDIKILLVGDGALRREIEEIVVKNDLQNIVKFLGVQAEVNKIISIFDVFIMPSIYEGLGGAAIEAQACGVSCVLSNTLPEEVDMGIGLVKFLSLEEGVDKWVNEILESVKTNNKPQKELILSRFKEKGFLLEDEIKRLLEIYEINKRGVER